MVGQFAGFGVGRVTCWALAHVLRAVSLKCSQFAGRFELNWDWGSGCSSAAVVATRGSNSESRTWISGRLGIRAGWSPIYNLIGQSHLPNYRQIRNEVLPTEEQHVLYTYPDRKRRTALDGIADLRTTRKPSAKVHRL